MDLQCAGEVISLNVAMSFELGTWRAVEQRGKELLFKVLSSTLMEEVRRRLDKISDEE